LIAEEVAQVYPELVTRDENGVINGVRYEALTPILLKELQGQHRQITTQAQQLTAQDQRLAVQTQQLAAQAQQLTTQVQHQAVQDQQLAVQAQQMQVFLQQQAAQAQQLAELKLQNDALRAAVDRLQGPAAVALTAASRLQ